MGRVIGVIEGGNQTGSSAVLTPVTDLPAGATSLASAGAGSSAADLTSTFKSGYNTLRGPLNEIGQAIAAEIQQAPQQTDAQVGADFSSLASRFQAQLSQLQTLKPPADLQADWNSVISAAQRLESDLNAIAAAAATHNTSAAQQAGATLSTDASELTSALKPIKAQLGLP